MKYYCKIQQTRYIIKDEDNEGASYTRGYWKFFKTKFDICFKSGLSNEIGLKAFSERVSKHRLRVQSNLK